jgi:hypothetical protein
MINHTGKCPRCGSKLLVKLSKQSPRETSPVQRFVMCLKCRHKMRISATYLKDIPEVPADTYTAEFNPKEVAINYGYDPVQVEAEFSE